jgi:hypothetical protein
MESGSEFQGLFRLFCDTEVCKPAQVAQTGGKKAIEKLPSIEHG